MSMYDSRIQAQAQKMGVPLSVIPMIIAQARNETNDYTSNVFKLLNNAFGYHYVGQKKWASGSGSSVPAFDAGGNPDGGKYAAYTSLENSVGELVDWLYRRQGDGVFNVADLVTPELYAQGLKDAGYYGESWQLYAADMASKLKKILLTPAGGIITALLIVGAFFFSVQA